MGYLRLREIEGRWFSLCVFIQSKQVRVMIGDLWRNDCSCNSSI